jgi:hypothetical protein
MGLVWVLLSSLIACGNAGVYEEIEKPATKITPDDPVSPKRIRFDVYGDPYSPPARGSKEERLPVYLKIRAGMRRYAAEKE